MATTQTAAKSNTRSEAAKKAAATRAANKAGATTGAVEGPRGRRMADSQNTAEVPVEQRQGERRQQQENAIAQFTPQQHTTPAAHATELQGEQGAQADDVEAAKQQAFEAAVKAMAETMGVPMPELNAQQPAPVKQGSPRADKQQRNGITRPAQGSTTGLVWDVADEISVKKQGEPAAIAELRADPRLRQHNEHTLKTQYARWRSYHGVKGQVAAAPKAQAATPTGQASTNAPEVQTEEYQGPDRREPA